MGGGVFLSKFWTSVPSPLPKPSAVHRNFCYKGCCYGGELRYAKMYHQSWYNVKDLPHFAQVQNISATLNVSFRLFFAVFQQSIFHQCTVRKRPKNTTVAEMLILSLII